MTTQPKSTEEKYLEGEKYKIIKLFALKNGWNHTWFINEKTAMESLYDRDFSLEEAAFHAVRYDHYPMSMHQYINPNFLEFFFKPFPKVEMISLPEITAIVLNSPMTSPRIIEKSRFEDAWKYHAQKLVLLPDGKRLDYLFDYVDKWTKDIFRKFRDERFERLNKNISNHPQ